MLFKADFTHKLVRCGLIPVLLAVAYPAFAAEPLFPRAGLPNVAARLARCDSVRVAFLGGSITYAAGWRVDIMRELRSHYPCARFEEIFAAVPGTGSGFGAARLQRDVLVRHPDLLFVEFAVNDNGVPAAKIGAQLEGIVRQAWSADAHTDIAFVYTVAESQLAQIRARGIQDSAAAQEAVAGHYGVPSLNWGVEVLRRLDSGTLVMSAPLDEPPDATGSDRQGRLIFTRDGTHPTAAGAALYTQQLLHAWPAMLGHGSDRAHELPAPLYPDHWQRARVVLLADTVRTGDWQLLPVDAPQLAEQGRTGVVPPIWHTAEAGASVRLRFKGTQFGLAGLKGADSGRFAITIDGMTAHATLFDAYSTPGRHPLSVWFWPHALADKAHTVQIALLPDRIDKAAIMAARGMPTVDPVPYMPHRLYLGGILMVGEPMPGPVNAAR